MPKHIVTCRYCKQQFDTNTTEYVMPSNKQYFHKGCYELKEAETVPVVKRDPNAPKKADNKKCFYCGEILNIGVDEYAMPTPNRYAHKKCYDENYTGDTENIDRIYQYLKKVMFGKYNYQMCEKQREGYIKNKGYTNEGIFNALRYFYEVQHGNAKKANGGIGIVPFVYDEAKVYYETLEKRQKTLARQMKAQMKNATTKTITITHAEKKQERKLIDIDSLGGNDGR